MKNIWTIAKRDYRQYFTSPIAYIVIAVFLLIMGWMFFFNLKIFWERNLQYSQFNMGKAVSITEGIIQPVYGNMNVVLLFLLPFVSMRLFAEERRQHTIELLMTAPVTLWEIILGKYLSAVLFLLTTLGITLVYPAVLFYAGNPEAGPVITNYLGTALLSSCILAMGVWFSSMTENQIVAGVLTITVGLFFWIISWAAQSAGPVWSDVLNHLSIITHFMNSFSHGILNTTDIFYYVSFIFFMLFLTHRVLDSYRWR